MDAHTVRNARWLQSYDLKKLNYKIRGYSRAAFRTGFYIPELGIMLDAGPQCFNKPHHIFITHCHADHVAELPFTLIGDETGKHVFNIYGPVGSERHVGNYIQSMFTMNCMSQTPIRVRDWYKYRELRDGEEMQLKLKNNDIRVQVIKCDHSIPTVSYIFRIMKDKLKPEYLELPGREIGSLRKQGVEITYKMEKHLFSYVCDCSIKTIQLHEVALSKCPYVIVECTFIWDDEIENAKETKHIHWQQLEPFVAKYPKTEWILIHFSLRYKDSEIMEFFKKHLEKYDNLKIWVDEVTRSVTKEGNDLERIGMN